MRSHPVETTVASSSICLDAFGDDDEVELVAQFDHGAND